MAYNEEMFLKSEYVFLMDWSQSFYTNKWQYF